MPLPGAEKLITKGVKKGVKTLKGKRGKKGAGQTGRRRPKRIVFSERQWQFTSQLIRMASGRRMPGFPRGKRRRKSRFF